MTDVTDAPIEDTSPTTTGTAVSEPIEVTPPTPERVPLRIRLRDLEELDACNGYLERFRTEFPLETFPDGVEPTPEVCHDQRANWDWEWAASRFLTEAEQQDWQRKLSAAENDRLRREREVRDQFRQELEQVSERNALANQAREAALTRARDEYEAAMRAAEAQLRLAETRARNRHAEEAPVTAADLDALRRRQRDALETTQYNYSAAAAAAFAATWAVRELPQPTNGEVRETALEYRNRLNDEAQQARAEARRRRDEANQRAERDRRWGW